MAPQPNDVVICQYESDSIWELSIFPWKRLKLYRASERVVEFAMELAKQEHVDAWYTDDLRQFTRVAHCRESQPGSDTYTDHHPVWTCPRCQTPSLPCGTGIGADFCATSYRCPTCYNTWEYRTPSKWIGP